MDLTVAVAQQIKRFSAAGSVLLLTYGWHFRATEGHIKRWTDKIMKLRDKGERMYHKAVCLAAILLAGGAYAESITHGSTTINMNFVDIGYAGNVPDTTGYGAVDYDYRLGQYEVTIEQFMAVQAADNRVGDGDEGYWNDGIRTAGINAPVSYVTMYESAMFCNWLTTGNAYEGAYQFDDAGTLTNVMTRAQMDESGGLFYVLPTENEWYKAAYYKPVNDSSYSLYADGTDTVPTWGTTNGWNYLNGNGERVNSSPNYAWETGFGAEEQNGTYDMMGNVLEWIESASDGVLDNMDEYRILRGNNYANGENTLRSTYRNSVSPSNKSRGVGFRVASIGTVSPPVEAVRLSMQMNEPDSVKIFFLSVVGTTYQMQYSTNLASDTWFDIGSLVNGNGTTNVVVDDTGIYPCRFYRVHAE